LLLHQLEVNTKGSIQRPKSTKPVGVCHCLTDLTSASEMINWGMSLKQYEEARYAVSKDILSTKFPR